METTPKAKVGPLVDLRLPCTIPPHISLIGNYIKLVPINVHNGSLSPKMDSLYTRVIGHDSLWDYMMNGPFENEEEFNATLKYLITELGFLFWAVTNSTTNENADADVLGVIALLANNEKSRTVEVGHVLFTQALARTRAATEVQYLLAKHTFASNYRRYEWKCNDLNLPSKNAALRLGFTFEGTFRQHLIVKGRNRDTAWYSMLDSEWNFGNTVFCEYLRKDNFDKEGIQKESLSKIRERLIAASLDT